MSIQGQLHRDVTGNITIHMKGALEFENSSVLKQELDYITRKNPNTTVTIDMDCVDFVGSSGIVMFIEMIKEFNKNKKRVHLKNLKNEFIKIFKIYNLSPIESIIENFETDDTMNIGPDFAGRKVTFEN